MREFDKEVADLGGRVAVISFADPDRLARFAQRLNHPYLWLADPARASYRALGLGRGGVGAVVPLRVIRDYIRSRWAGRSGGPNSLTWPRWGATSFLTAMAI